MSIKRGYRTSEVVNLTGLTQRQLDHWDRTGLFKPSLSPAGGKGSARFYSFLDVVQLQVAKKLLDAGLSFGGLRKCLIFLQRNLKENNFSALSLVTDGNSIFMITEDPKVIVDLLEQGQAVWAVRLKDEGLSNVV